MADNPNLSRSGQVNLQGDPFALYRDQFEAELITEFHGQQKIKEFVKTKTIEKGKSASFPNIGKVDAKYVYAGEVLIGNQQIAHSETTINLDPFLVADIKIPEVDTLMAEYDDREQIKKEMAMALAEKEERQQLIVGLRAARAGGMLVGRPGGSVVKAPGSKTDPEKLCSAIFAAIVAMKEKNVRMTDVACFVRPAEAAMLVQYDKVTDKNLGGSGSFSEGYIGKIGGIPIIETTFLPQENVERATGDENKPNNIYYGDFSNTVALMLKKGAVGTVARKKITVACDWLPTELTWLLTARNLQGHGILDPRCAVEIVDEA